MNPGWHVAAMLLALPGTATAQTSAHDRHMPVMAMPEAGPPSPSRSAQPTSPAVAPACPPEHARMGHCTPASAAATDTAPAPPAGTDLPAGDAPPPPPADPTYADRVWNPQAMARARATMRREHGGGTFSQVMLNIAEIEPRSGADGYRWDGEGWFGGDIDRLVVKSEGDGRLGDRLDHGEVQALYGRAIGPYFNLQAGMRQDFGAGKSRRYAVAGIEGLAPYWFDVEGAVFLSDRGDLLGRAEGWYDQRITQRLVLQPRVELNLSVQQVADSRIGAGLVDAEAGLRLRYEFAREFAPYLGVSWQRSFAGTRRLARAAGDDTGGVALALGVRGWF